MKPWLLNILACPIDKHHPLEAHFFTWETHEEVIKKYTDNIGTPSSEHDRNYKQLAKQLTDGTISPTAIKNITDLSKSQNSKNLLTRAIDAIVRFEEAEEKSEEALLKECLKDIDALNRYMHLLEVDAGLLVCPECGRWYPIGSAVETIPEMLPDDLREKDRDLEWMEKWSHLIPVKVLEEGKPYSIKKQ
jgi:uncharacterized protein YbaR (Trm112 family)